MACHHQKTPKILLEVSRDHYAHCFCKFPTTGKSPWITSLPFVPSFPVTPLYTRYPEILLVNPWIPWAYCRAAPFALRIIPHITGDPFIPSCSCASRNTSYCYPISQKSSAAYCFKDFSYLLALWLVPHVKQSSWYPLSLSFWFHWFNMCANTRNHQSFPTNLSFRLRRHSGYELVLGKSILDWPSNSSHHTRLFIRASASDPPILES